MKTSKFFKTKIVILFTLCLITNILSAQNIISLYDGPAPGSETWDWKENQIMAGGEASIIYNVVEPTLTVFPADPAIANGTSVIIAPGGAFHILSFINEGKKVAQWLNSIGITAFVLKYRLVKMETENPMQELMGAMSDFDELDRINAPVVKMALNDGLTAMNYVRTNATKYNINPGKIGFMGFSAGGTVTMSVVLSATDETRPNFIAPIYAYKNAVLGNNIPKAETPAFIAAASDDNLGLAPHSVQIYSEWLEAGQPVELHMYERGSHGFGMNKTGIPTDSWPERMKDWMEVRGLLTQKQETNTETSDPLFEPTKINLKPNGPYNVVIEADNTLPTHTIYRPENLSAFSKNNPLPIVAWANGGCSNTSIGFKNALVEMASNGFLVVAIGAPDIETVENPTKSTQLIDAVDWAVAENKRNGSKYNGKIDTEKIAVMGQSCGGLQTIEIASDPRITTAIVWNSGVLNSAPPAEMANMLPKTSKDDLLKMHSPVIYILGGESDIAFENGSDDFSRIDHIPVMLANLDVGHGGTYSQPHGGEFAKVGIEWLKWMLKDSKDAGKMFLGDDCGLCNTEWTLERKNLHLLKK